MCGLANDDATLIVARAVQGVGAAIAAPTGLALIATTYAVGRTRNQAMAVSAAMQGIGSVLGLVLGGAVHGDLLAAGVPDQHSDRHRHHLIALRSCAKLTTSGSNSTRPAQLLATLACTTAVLLFTQGPPRAGSIRGSSVPACQRRVLRSIPFRRTTAENPLVPLSLFADLNRVMTFVSLLLAGGVMLSLSVMIGLYTQIVMGYCALHAGICFIPFAIAFGVGSVSAARVAPLHRAALADHRRRPVRPRRRCCTGTRSTAAIPYFPDLFLPFVIGGFGIGMISVILPLCAVADVGPHEIGPVSSITLMVQNLGGPLVSVVIQAVQTSRTLFLGGTTGPVKTMTPAQLDALDTATRIRCCGSPGRAVRRRRALLHPLLGPADRGSSAHSRSGGGR